MEQPWSLNRMLRQFENCAALHAEVPSRTVMRNKVIDHEWISGLREQPFEAAVVYEVVDGLIRSGWFFTPE